jgi:hypothetical protein
MLSFDTIRAETMISPDTICADKNAVVVPAANHPPAAPTPKQKQQTLTAVLMEGGSSAMTPAKEKATAKAAQAAVAGLSPGGALKSASLPATSKKRRHSFSTKQVGRSDNSAGDRQNSAGMPTISSTTFLL